MLSDEVKTEIKNKGPSDPQSDPYIKLKEELSFFKINLPCEITPETSETVNLCLPSYGISYQNFFYDDPQFQETVDLVQEKIVRNPRDVIVLAGVSDGGKTTATFGIAVRRWSIYIDFTTSNGTYGKAFHILDMVILSRGILLLKMLIKKKVSTPKEWLFTLINKINDCLKINRLTLIFDEAQVLCRRDYGEYKGSTNSNKRWNLL
ncbi:hypothetical protein C1645_822579 [Glomus cerebriforme]|uniref:P-loop containing nucleoside triphosphate hydrolase protein n=1 Tax=Glomus cerebriforme TaxID=658196 RepID=A0A397T3X9_9GLOM|nr:hypothetical protein C1645_822579 [Glomus cerebriforme]